MTKHDFLLFGSWGMATIATTGSLFLSEVMNYIPCDLCWYQRIFMYPLTIILGVAVLRGDYHQSKNSLYLSAIGGTISLYHYLIQMFPITNVDSCGRIPCNVDYLNWFGFITIPLLAHIAFTFIFIASLHLHRELKSTAQGELQI